MTWWQWTVLGGILLGAELLGVDAQFYLIFIGLSALLVGLAELLGIAMPLWVQVAVFAAFSLVFLVDDVLIAARDPHGFRPLSLGRLGGAWIVASETCAFDLIGASYERDVEPGEVVVIRRGRARSRSRCAPGPRGVSARG